MNKSQLKAGVVFLLFICATTVLHAINAQDPKPRILISSDIGGTDPDDNQSMIHLLMYNDLFEIEGLVSSPSYGDGSADSIYAMIDLYEKDYPTLLKQNSAMLPPDSLRALCKQGSKKAAPYAGFRGSTEGSDWIIRCAKKSEGQPLWILVWGGLDDVAQALHDAPEIRYNIKIYWIGGPNKKWSVNSYAFIASTFPELWFIEVNASYRGFFADEGMPSTLKNATYFSNYIKGNGNLGSAFRNYYKGDIKMGDTPSLFYVMDGDAEKPTEESWGGSFDKFTHSPRYIFNRPTSLKDTVKVYSVVEFHIQGPKINIPADSACFLLHVTAGIGLQKWKGYYLGGGKYAVRYTPKQAEQLSYSVSSRITDFPEFSGKITVNNEWPGEASFWDYELGENWYTDRVDPQLFIGKWQGAKTVQMHRKEALLDWAGRWKWLE